MNFTILQEKALAKGFKSVELFSETKSGVKIETFNKEVSTSTSYSTTVYAVRGMYKSKSGLYYTEQGSDDSIDLILDTIISNIGVVNSKDPSFFYKGDKGYKVLPEETSNFHEYSLTDKTNLCFELESLLLAKNKAVFGANISYNEVSTTFNLQNSNGLNLEKKSTYASLFANVICKNKKVSKSGFEYQVVSNFTDFDLKKMVSNVVATTVKSLNADTIPSGQYPVILQNNVASDLLHVYSQIFSADAVIRKTTFLADELGNKVFGDNISIIDDPLYKKSFTKHTFDDEGVKAKKTVLVENGVFKSFLHNLKTAKMLKTKSTSNGFKHSVSSPVEVAPSNLYVVPQKNKVSDLYKACENGVLITSLQGMHAGVNPITGDFNLQASGFMIENSKLGKAVTLIVLSGNIKDVYNNISLIANDLQFKGSSVASPSLLVKSMAISGKN